MSPPGPSWRIRGGTNFRSQARAATNPRKAAHEWLALADAITAAGAQVLVMPPASTIPPLTGMIYTANSGALLGGRFLVAKMWAPHRVAEADPVEALARKLGVTVSRAEHTWEGQAEICTLPADRYILSYGVRSVRDSVDEVRQKLPAGASTLDVELRDPYFHGDTCMVSLRSPRGPLLLACEAALVDRTLGDLRAFATGVEVIAVDEKDALAYACNALGVGDAWLAPRGLSAALLAEMRARGMNVVELDLSELFGKGGGGPRCLVNELFGLTQAPDKLRLETQRSALEAQFAAYPEHAAPE
jgi:N-dimethylarginine dimethylaminohydrolase